MKTNRKFTIDFLLVAIIVLAGCRAPEKTALSSGVSLPPAFPGQADTTGFDLSWRAYFTDHHLVALIDSALARSFDVRAAWERVEMARANVWFRKGMMKPSADMGVWMNQQKFGRYTMDGAGNLGTDMEEGRVIPTHLREYFPGIQASWEVDIRGKLRSQREAAINRFLASQEGRNLVMTGLIAEIATRYYRLMGLDTEMKTLDETIVLQENAYRMVTLQKEAAAANELAVRQFEAQVLNSKSRRWEVRQQITELENHINFLLGRLPQPVLRDSLADADLPAQVHTGLPATLLLNRPDIRQAERELLATRADVHAARAAFYPELTLSGNIGLQAYRTSLLFLSPESFAYGLFGGLTAPLFNRSALRADLQFANAQQRHAYVDYQRAIVGGYTEVVNHLAAIHTLNEAYDLKEQESEAWSRSIEASTELFRTGRATSLEVIVTQQNALQAKLELIDIRERQLITAVSLYRALGGGWQ